jgi:hypothetical protein
LVAGSIPVSRSRLRSLASFVQAGCVIDASASSQKKADVAQLAERVLGKDEVTSSILVIGSNLRSLRRAMGRQASSMKVVYRSAKR